MGEAARSHRVLLVDDQRIIGESVRRTLADHADIVYEFVSDPNLAMDRADEFEPTVILQDLVMPDVDGLELVRRYRESSTLKHVPLVVLSVKEDPEIKAQAFALGVNDYLVKLPSSVELVARIRHHSTAYLHARQSRQAFEALKASQEQLRQRNEEIRRQRDVLARQARELELKNLFIRTTFGRYLSDDVVKSLLESPEGLELGGELRTVTIMMSDLRGFTGISERLSPHQLLSLLNGYLGTMTDIIMSYRGTIDEFLGDAILAIFGAPHSGPDDAERAVAAAIEMQLAMADINERHAADQLPPIEMGIALHTGEVVVGNIGSQTRAKYGVVGQHVNVASRLESSTLGGQVLLSQACREAAGSVVEVSDPCEVRAKGVTDPIQAYGLRGIGGKYGLWLPEAARGLETVKPPVPVRYRKLDGKLVGEEEQGARIVRASRTEAELCDTVGLSAMDNIMLRVVRDDGSEIREDLYAKIVSVNAETVRVRFTSLAPEALSVLEGRQVSSTSHPRA